MATTRRRSTLPPFLTKPGRHGVLYRFHVRYRDRWDPASPDFDTFMWAYNADHAEEKFHDGEDEGWKILSIEKIRQR